MPEIHFWFPPDFRIFDIFFLPQISTLMEVEKDFFCCYFVCQNIYKIKIINRKLTDLFADLPSINNRRNSIKMGKTIFFDSFYTNNHQLLSIYFWLRENKMISAAQLQQVNYHKQKLNSMLHHFSNKNADNLTMIFL